MKPSGRNLNLTSYDEIFQTEETRIEATQEKVIDIPLTDLHPFKNHPFKVTDDESMLETAESITKHGVLVPVIAREPLTVLFTLRTAHLASHAGQVSFPGGKIDDDDENAIATALREAHEEVALLPEQIEPLGFLDTYHTSTGYSVAPLVALVDPHHTAVPNPDEVADIFEVPLAFLMAPENIALNARMWQGRERHFYAFTFGPRYIWGATAGILNNMRTRLFT